MTRKAEHLYQNLQAAGIGVLYDDRNLSAGVMFADADLIGLPLRITISPRSVESGGIEVKWRHENDRTILSLEGAVEEIRAMLAEARQQAYSLRSESSSS